MGAFADSDGDYTTPARRAIYDRIIRELEDYRPHFTDPDYTPDYRGIIRDIYAAAGMPLDADGGER